VGQRRHEAERFPSGALADRDVDAGVPPVELNDLAREVTRALEGAGREEAGPDGGQVLLEDRDAAPITALADPLEDDRFAIWRLVRCSRWNS
jgi:hypothetical protein